MKRFQWLALLSSAFLYGDCEVVEEECCDTPHHVRCHANFPSVEEEYIWQKRAESEWAGKRDDNLIDAFLHQ